MPLLPLLFSLIGKMSPILDLFKKHWKIFAVLAVIGLAALYVYNLNSQISNLQKNLTQVTADLAAKDAECLLSISQLEGSIEVQNAEIEKLNKDLIKKEQQIKDAAKRGKDIRKKFDDQIVQILNSNTPSSCEESIQFLIDGKEDLKW